MPVVGSRVGAAMLVVVTSCTVGGTPPPRERQAPRSEPGAPSLVRSSPPPQEAQDLCGGAVIGMGCVPPGPFSRGSNEGPANEQPEAVIELDAFLMDATEVTVEAYEAC